jgi:hypothetical protein
MVYSLRKLSELDACIKDPFSVAKTGAFYTGDLLCIPLPGWEGWRQTDYTRKRTFGHVARWEIYFTTGAEQFTIILRVTWPLLAEVLLEFLYPDDRLLVSLIVRHRCIALLDRELLDGEPDPRSYGIMVEEIPCDLPVWFGLDSSFPRDWLQ